MNRDVVIMGVGMHPWGKWMDADFVDYGLVATSAALKDAGIKLRDVDYIACGATWFAGVSGFLTGSVMSRSLGWSGVPCATSSNACATGGYALDIARQRILSGASDIVLVIGAEKNPKGFFPPMQSIAREDLDELRFSLIGATNPTYFAMEAMRRMHDYGTTEEDLALVKVKNSKHGKHNQYARYRQEYTLKEVMESAMVASPLRLLMLPATSHGGAAIVLASKKAAKKYTNNPVMLASVGIASHDYPNPHLHLRIAGNSEKNMSRPAKRIEQSACARAYEEAGIGPEDIDVAELYDLGSNFELDYMEFAGLCKPGEADILLRKGETSVGGKIPVNTSGGLSSFGEAIPAQALQQVIEITWQLRGAAGERQVKGAKVGLTMNLGLEGNCSSSIIRK
jgi:acetyl-CoA acetyltransferase